MTIVAYDQRLHRVIAYRYGRLLKFHGVASNTFPIFCLCCQLFYSQSSCC